MVTLGSQLRFGAATRRITPGPTPGVDLWWSGKHDNHGGNIQVITVPDGWPIWTSDVRPGREHDTTALRTHTEILPTLTDAGDDLRALGDQGYEGESDTITVAFKKPKGGRLTLIQQQLNKAHNSVRAIGCRRTRQLPAEDDLQSATQRHPGPVADREDRRRGACHSPPRPRPHHMTAFSSQMLARNGSVSSAGDTARVTRQAS